MLLLPGGSEAAGAQAHERGLRPSRFVFAGSAPAPSSSAEAPTWPEAHANMRGVSPLELGTSTSPGCCCCCCCLSSAARRSACGVAWGHHRSELLLMLLYNAA